MMSSMESKVCKYWDRLESQWLKNIFLNLTSANWKLALAIFLSEQQHLLFWFLLFLFLPVFYLPPVLGTLKNRNQHLIVKIKNQDNKMHKHQIYASGGMKFVPAIKHLQSSELQTALFPPSFWWEACARLTVSTLPSNSAPFKLNIASAASSASSYSYKIENTWMF